MTMMRALVTVGILLILALCGAQARPRDEVMAQLFHCNSLKNDRQWLDCYYGAAQLARASLGLKSALPGQIQLAQSALPGESLTSRMVEYNFDSQGIFTVTLENGQTWRQIDGDSRSAFWKKPAGTYLVTIRRGMSGSFILTVHNESRAYRVHHVR